jgi:uncharacterized protein (DUF362 family)
MPADFDEVRATIVDDAEASPPELLSRALDASGLWTMLAARCAQHALQPVALRIVIKPDLSAFSSESPTATDPRLVEALIDALHQRGYSQVSLVASSDSSALWAENRTVLALAELLGYRYTTSRGHAYDIHDLADDVVPVDFPAGALLSGSPLSRSWIDADFRILFAKNRTDEVEGYALTLDSLIGILPLQDKDYYYRQRFDPGMVAVELLRTVPPQFALVDAVVSSHGSGGLRAPLPIQTRTLIASSSPLLADFAGALKMGVDPSVSRITGTALRSLGLPNRYRLEGNLAVYDGWRPVHPIALDAVRTRDAWVSISRTVKPWVQQTDSASFPLKDPLNVRANEILAGRFADIDQDQGAFALYVVANYGIGLLYDFVNAYQVIEAKDGLRRQHASLGIDPAAFPLADYEAPLSDLEQMRRLLRDRPRDANALRWMYVDKSVVFEFDRVFPVSFDEFVSRIDVARTIQFMNDYIGGVVVPVATDDAGRVTHQAERNQYLPQPNYLVLAKGDLIDVTKLEYVQYTADRHRMAWKTIKSENGSAEFDDGVVTFSRRPKGTLVNIFGRQLFTLPPFWQAINLDLLPTLKTQLVTHAYTTFFQRTFSNFEALLEGRNIQIGKAWHVPADTSATEPLLSDKIAKTVTDLLQRHGSVITGVFGKVAVETPLRVDDLGFSHFRPGGKTPVASDPEKPGDVFARAWSQFWLDLAAAARRDFDMRT